MAAKPAAGRLNYGGDYLPVSDLHCIANGLGSIPTLELIRELLPGSDSSIERANFVWVNEEEGQFVLYDDVERLWYKYSRNLDISCVLEKDCFGPGLLQNNAFLEVSSAHPKYSDDGWRRVKLTPPHPLCYARC